MRFRATQAGTPPGGPQDRPAEGPPVIMVVGGDALALAVCAELVGLASHRVSVLWYEEPELAAAVTRLGGTYTRAAPDSADGLERAAVRQAVSILALSDDDRLNLHVALRARDLNPVIRIVLRQFNRTLGRKIEQNLPDCSVLSLASHSAATYAAAAIDDRCFFALQFPDIDGPLVGFARRDASQCGVAGLSVAEAERRLRLRIVAAGGARAVPDTPLSAGAELVLFGSLTALEACAAPRRHRERTPLLVAWLRDLPPLGRRWRRRIDPMLAGVVGTAVAVAAAAIWYFHRVFGTDLVTAAYFVVTTMSTTGYGDLTPQHYGALPMLAGMALMFAGVGFFGIFTALLTTRLARAHAVRIHGLRRVRRHGHVLVCGAGNIGTAVVEYLLEQGRRVVVVERQPDPVLVEWAQERRLDLLTGDATRDATLDLCNLGEAHSVVALTNSDTMNLETALGARARNPALPCVLRIADAEFATSIARHFGFATTFSAAALAAPAFTGLSRLANRRGRVSLAGCDYGIGDEAVAEVPPQWAGSGGIPLAAWRDDAFLPLRHAAELRMGDRALYLVPLAASEARGEAAHEAADNESAPA